MRISTFALLAAATFAGPALADNYTAPPTIPAGSSGAIQTNNGSGRLGSIAPGTGVATMLGNAVNTAGGATLSTWPETGNSVQFYPFIGPGPVSYSASGAFSITLTYCAPFTARDSIHIDNIYAYMTTGGGSTSVNFALYNDAIDANGRHYPQAPYNTATLAADTGSSNTLLTFPISSAIAIPAVRNWICFQAGDTTVRMDGVVNTTIFAWYTGVSSTASMFSTPFGPQSYTSTYGTFPTNTAAGTLVAETSLPAPWYRVYSNP